MVATLASVGGAPMSSEEPKPKHLTPDQLHPLSAYFQKTGDYCTPTHIATVIIPYQDRRNEINVIVRKRTKAHPRDEGEIIDSDWVSLDMKTGEVTYMRRTLCPPPIASPQTRALNHFVQGKEKYQHPYNEDISRILDATLEILHEAEKSGVENPQKPKISDSFVNRYGAAIW